MACLEKRPLLCKEYISREKLGCRENFRMLVVFTGDETRHHCTDLGVDLAHWEITDLRQNVSLRSKSESDEVSRKRARS